MSLLNAMILGLIQGIAEFLPISSSDMFFDVLRHRGTLFSVCVVYWQDIVQMFYEVLGFLHAGPLAGERRAHYPAARLFLMIVLGTLPLFLILPINDMMEGLYYKSVFIGVMLVLTGCILYISDKMQQGKKTEKNMSMLDAIIIGLCQAAATIPGLSRSGTTITAGLATGLRRDFAVKYSFLLSLPAVLGANILAFAKAIRTGVDWSCLPAYLVGTVVAILSGIASISLLKHIAAKGKFGGFAYYCWVVGVLSIILTIIF